MLRHLSAFVFLYAFWILLSGYFTPFLLISGALSALAVVWLARRMDLIDREGHPIHLLAKVALYWVWLVKEIIKSAWDVSKIVLHPALPISPTLVRIRPSQRTDVGLVLHANSITLTPGTITVQASADEFLVHALTRSGAEGVQSGDMDGRVAACEERH